jgi:hypothetical protein
MKNKNEGTWDENHQLFTYINSRITSNKSKTRFRFISRNQIEVCNNVPEFGIIPVQVNLSTFELFFQILPCIIIGKEE